MTLYVFAGPTISAADARAELDAVYLPPAAQGDVLRAALEKPWAIGIVDGYFERVPSVWHKEILWAMSRGVHVYGSASMGALRAAELAPFGMVGVGAVYQAFVEGRLEDDDEVALAHAAAEDGYRPASEALVNVRATLGAAVSQGAIGEAARAALVAIAKGLHYPERSYPTLLGLGASSGIAAGEIEALRAFLRAGRIDQKRDDAIAMLRAMRAHLAIDPAPKRVGYAFEHTDAWEGLRRSAARLPLGGAPGADLDPDAPSLAALHDELVAAGRWEPARRGAFVRALSVEEAQREGRALSTSIRQQALDDFRRARGLLEPADFERWMADQRLPRARLSRFIEDEAHAGWAATRFEQDVTHRLPDHLRSTGEYGALVDRIQDKRRLLDAHGQTRPELADAGLTEAELWQWHFQERLGAEVPADLDAHARRAGCSGAEELRRIVLRERCYLRLLASRPRGG